jgi:tetratricopeptide (TPR) repeat protein
MKPIAQIIFLISASVFSVPPALAENASWQNSYQFETAGKYVEAIAAIDPVPANSTEAELKTLRRGWLFYLLGRYDESIREYGFAIQRNSRSIDARVGITLPQLALKRWSDAAQNAHTALQMAPNNYTALLRLALALEGQKNWDEMAKVTGTLATNYPTDATAYVYLARAKAWQGKTDEAVAAYVAVLSRYPGHLEAKAYLEKK